MASLNARRFANYRAPRDGAENRSSEAREEWYMHRHANRGHLWLLIGCLALVGVGCTHVISDTLRQQAQPPVPFAELRVNPEAFRGRTVIAGGEIIETVNLRDSTRIEVLQRP